MTYDLIVVGLGIYGAAISEEASRKGLTVLGVDKFSPPHGKGSSHGSSRIFRLTAVESDEYTELARSSFDIWKQLDEELEGALLVPKGFALISQESTSDQLHHGVDDIVKRAATHAQKYDIKHEVMSGSEFKVRFPALLVKDTDSIFYEPGAFLIRPEIAVNTLIQKAKMYSNFTILTGVEAKDVKKDEDSDLLEITIGDKVCTAKNIILSTGPWQHESLLGENIIGARVKPQVSLKININKHSSFVEDFPSFAYISSNNSLLFGTSPGDGLGEYKLGIEQEAFEISSPDLFPRSQKFINDSIKQIIEIAKCILPKLDLSTFESDLCYYTVTSDSKHIVSSAENLPGVTVVSACSGHGFKYAPAIARNVVASIL